MKTVKNKKYYSIRDLAEALDIPYQTVHRWVKQEDIQMVKIINRQYFTEKKFKELTK